MAIAENLNAPSPNIEAQPGEMPTMASVFSSLESDINPGTAFPAEFRPLDYYPAANITPETPAKPSATEQTPAEPGAQEQPAEEEPREEPSAQEPAGEQPQINPQILALAESFGLNAETCKQYGEQYTLGMLAGMARNPQRGSAVAEESPSANRPEPYKPFSFQFDKEQDSDLSDRAKFHLESLTQHVNDSLSKLYQSNEANSLASVEATNRLREQWFDGEVEALVKENPALEKVFGKGPMSAQRGPALDKRLDMIRTHKALNGNQWSFDRATLKRASMVVAADEYLASARSSASEEARKPRGPSASEPTRTRKVKPDPNAVALDALDTHLKGRS